MELLEKFARIRNRAKKEHEKNLNNKLIVKDMPHLYGLLAVAGSSGLSGEASLKTIARFVPQSIAEPIIKAVTHIESGKDFRSALAIWDDVPALRPLAHILVESLESGTSAVPAFDAMGRDALNKVRRNTDTAMKRLPVTMLFPLVVCILPAFMLLSIVPTLISGFTNIQW